MTDSLSWCTTASLPNRTFTLVALNQLWWECLHHGSWQTLQIKGSPYTQEDWRLDIYQNNSGEDLRVQGRRVRQGLYREQRQEMWDCSKPSCSQAIPARALAVLLSGFSKTPLHAYSGLLC